MTNVKFNSVLGVLVLFGTLLASPLYAGAAAAGSADDKSAQAKSAQASAQEPTTGSGREVLKRGKSDIERISREARHELVMLPYYSVFDNLAFEVRPDGTLVLMGQVARPSLKNDAANRVRDIEGVERVDNRIEVLPTSINDDRLRRDVYRAIYGHQSLSRYAWGAVPPIHIIVKNGQVTLEGVVDNETDKNIANIQANGVSGVFKVTNNLRVESE
jgi:hyperosmotically inducible protein